jgi:hypothetical protein
MLLNLPVYSFRTKTEEGKKMIFDARRRKWVALTPEEWVRQHFARYLTEEKNYPAGRMGIEYGLKINGLDFRADIVEFDQEGNPLLIVECKAPQVKISQDVFDQIVRYNFRLQVKYLIVTNGINHYCCVIDREKLSYSFLPEIPDYKNL